MNFRREHHFLGKFSHLHLYNEVDPVAHSRTKCGVKIHNSGPLLCVTLVAACPSSWLRFADPRPYKITALPICWGPERFDQKSLY
jgi:hypothetical protein